MTAFDRPHAWVRHLLHDLERLISALESAGIAPEQADELAMRVVAERARLYLDHPRAASRRPRGSGARCSAVGGSLAAPESESFDWHDGRWGPEITDDADTDLT